MVAKLWREADDPAGFPPKFHMPFCILQLLWPHFHAAEELKCSNSMPLIATQRLWLRPPMIRLCAQFLTYRSKLPSTPSCPRGSSCGSGGWFHSGSRPAGRDPDAPSSPPSQSRRGPSPARWPSAAQSRDAPPAEYWEKNMRLRQKQQESKQKESGGGWTLMEQLIIPPRL